MKGVVRPVVGIVAVCFSVYLWVKPTNFGGADEWLLISLLSRNVIDIPYANRPLVLLWTWVGSRLIPHDLLGFYVVHGTYIALSGVLVWLLCRRLAPESPLTAFLAGALSTIWAPLDYLRLDTVLLAGYSGFTFATLLAIVLFIESWRRRSAPLLALGALFGFLAARGFEGVLGLLAAAPFLLAQIEKERSRQFWTWVASWVGLVAVAMLLAVLPLATAPLGSYQGSALGFDPRPLAVLARLVGQYGYHLLPLATTPLGELITPAVPVAVLVFALSSLAIARRGGDALGPEGRGRNLRLLLTGLVLAGLAYAPFTLSARILLAARTQVMSAPGIGLALAALIALGASALPTSWRRASVLALAGWVVALGAARTVAMQREWDEGRSRFPIQNHALVQLTRLAPDLAPHTVVVLLDEAGAFWATFTFRHAVEHLYGRQATGFVVGAEDFLYPTRFDREGILGETWPVVRRAWDSPPTFHRYDEVVVVRLSASGELSLLEEWPRSLPELPPGAGYAPRSRLRAESVRRPERGILRAAD